MDNVIPELTTGLYDQLTSSAILPTPRIVQILQPKPTGPHGQERWRVIISDGTHFLQALAVPQLNTLFENGQVGSGSIVRVQRLVVNTIGGRRIPFIYDLEVLLREAERIGNPTSRSLDSPGTTFEQSSVGESLEPGTVPTTPGRQTLPIRDLNTYSNNWTIKALVSHKSGISNWENQRGRGKLFNITLTDDTGEIRGVAFTQVVDQFYDKLEAGKVYYFSKARVNLAKKQFNNAAHEYELCLEKNTEIEECADRRGIPEVRNGFVKLGDLINKEVDSTCDVIAIVSGVGEATRFVTRAGMETKKRELTLVDRSNSPIRLTLWGEQADAFNDDGTNPVIVFEGVKIGDFQGRTLSMVRGSSMKINPRDIPDAQELRGWYDSVGATQTFANSGVGTGSGGVAAFNRADARSIGDITTNPENTERTEMFSCRGTIVYLNGENPAYPGCPNRSCKKKVVVDGKVWRCEKCGGGCEKPEYRYMPSMLVSDHTGQVRLQGFGDVGLAVFDMSADELMEIKENDPERYSVILSKSRHSTFNFTCRAKLDAYQGRSGMRYGISKILPLNYREETAYLRDILKTRWAD